MDVGLLEQRDSSKRLSLQVKRLRSISRRRRALMRPGKPQTGTTAKQGQPLLSVSAMLLTTPYEESTTLKHSRYKQNQEIVKTSGGT